ncbi:MAG: hypothetical protein WD397_09730 [Wenzhouxiangellaceae bacterium]
MIGAPGPGGGGFQLQLLTSTSKPFRAERWHPCWGELLWRQSQKLFRRQLMSSTLAGCGRLSNSTSKAVSPPAALADASDFFSIAKKVTKNALYRRQRVLLRVDEGEGLMCDRGFDPGSFCTF